MGSSNSKTKPTCTLAGIGQRVIPGPSWTRWSYRAIGPGYVGTVIAANPSHGTQEAGVVVLWDSGVLATYPSNRAGISPIRLYDSGPTGVQHHVGTCGECCGPMVGTRWKCSLCWEFNVCHTCYMDEKHSLDHAFYRFDISDGSGVKVPPRKDSAQINVLGIFPGAKVLRGQHWTRSFTVGEPFIGAVLNLGDSDDGSRRNQAFVMWNKESTCFCSVGHKGRVDIKCTEAASGGQFYPDHMPLIAPIEATPGNYASCATTFRSGDQVAIMLGVDAFRCLQKELDEINPDLEKDIYRLGIVQDVIRGGDVSVTFGTDLRWPVNPRLLTKVPVLHPGDEVTIIDDFDILVNFQVGHGGSIEAMRECLGQTGVVLKAFPTKDVRVLVGGAAWTFNRHCLRSDSATPDSDISLRLGEAAKESGLCDVVAGILPRILASSADVTTGISDRSSSMGHLFSEVSATTSKRSNERLSESSTSAEAGCSQGKMAHGKHIGPDENPMEGVVRVTRDWVNIESNEGSPRDEKRVNGMPLHLACHSGRVETVRLMATCGADLGKEDGDGDTPLHYAVHGNEAAVVELLLLHGVTVNATNKWNRTALHVAASKGFFKCARELVKCAGELDVNIQDDCGCTALHEAVRHNMDILALLLDDPHVDLHIQNDSGFNVLHLAAMNGNILATETIVSEAPELASVTDKGGYTPLHLAAMNGHCHVVRILLNQGDCMVDDLCSHQRTALWLAVSEGHVDITEFLVENGADVNKPDNNGNSPMHMSLLNRSKVQYHAIHASTTPCITAIFDHLLQFPKPGMDTSLAVAWFLARCGGDLHQMNDAGITPLQMANNIGEHVEESLLIWKTSISDGVDFGQGRETGRASGAGASENGPMNRSGAQSETGMAKRLRSILREMRSKCQEMEDVNVCALCCERPRNVAFTCGHRVCADCAKELTMCPWCRQRISRRITLY